MNRICYLILVLFSAVSLKAQDVLEEFTSCDSVLRQIDCVSDTITSTAADSDTIVVKKPKDYWRTQLRKGKLDLYDESIEYPDFLQFCVDVYRWGDKTFNTYDPDYVVGTGKRWKVMLRSDNWLDSYLFDGKRGFGIDNITMASNLSCNFGAYLSYMAVSVGYMFDLGKVFGGRPVSQTKFESNFTCALFNVDLFYFKNSNTSIRQFGNYNNKDFIREYFPGLSLESYGFDLFYFFNNKKYSQGAAYNFSKYQKRSAGSFIAGISISHQNVIMDFNELPESLNDYAKDHYPVLIGSRYQFKYNDFSLVLGYGYNWVFHRNWLLNVTAYPSIGFMHTFDNSVEGMGERFSFNFTGRLALVRNCGNFFYGLSAKIKDHWYHSENYNFVNSVENIMVNAGFRF